MLTKYLFSVFLCLASILYVSAQRLSYGDVSEVHDGSTVSVALTDGVTIKLRLKHIETPVLGQPLSDVVEDHLKQLVLNKRIALEFPVFNSSVIVSKITADGRDVSLQMIRDGAAWYVPDGSISSQDDADYRTNENAARAEKRGIWGIDGIVRPSVIGRNVNAVPDPISDPGVAQMALANFGPSMEGVFGPERYSESKGDCSGKVVGVTDGDTLKILTSANELRTVRLAGIDAPEKGQDFGMASKAELSAIAMGKTVSCESQKTDRYGRIVGKISVDGVDINLQMVKRCMAWHYKDYQSEQSTSDRSTYSQAETQARSAGCGMWNNANPTKPSDFRRDRFLSTFSSPTTIVNFPRGGVGGYYSPGTPAGTGNGPVQVRTYTRSDGTVVRGHTRSRPK